MRTTDGGSSVSDWRAVLQDLPGHGVGVQVLGVVHRRACLLHGWVCEYAVGAAVLLELDVFMFRNLPVFLRT